MNSMTGVLTYEVANALYHCQDGQASDIENHAYREETIIHAVDKYTSEDGGAYINKLKPLFNISKEEQCPDHKIASCGCDSSNYVEVRLYSYDIESLLRSWVDSVRSHQSGLFSKFELEQEDGEWAVKANTGRTEISFPVFLNGSRLERYNPSPELFEFPVSFVYSESLSEEYIFDWVELLNPDFPDTFIEVLSDLRESFATPIYEYDTIEPFRGQLRWAMKEYFRDKGYQVEGDKADHIGEASAYGIDLAQADFVVKGDDDWGSKILVCHCPIEDQWHGHYFEDKELAPMDCDEFETLIERVNDIIAIYDANKSSVNSVSKFMQSMGAIGGLLVALFLIGNISVIAQAFSNIYPGFDAPTIAIAVVSAIYLALVIVFIYLLIKPFYKDGIFRWDIREGRMNPNRRQKIKRLIE